jgi:hypothetical protein
MKKNPMKSFCDFDSVTFTCPCGESITGEGLAISEFIHRHKKHTNGKCVDTITDDGMRAFSTDIPRTRTHSIAEY